METKILYCDHCARGCEVKISEDNGKYYIQGNNCQGGEQTAMESLPFLKGRELHTVKPKRRFKW